MLRGERLYVELAPFDRTPEDERRLDGGIGCFDEEIERYEDIFSRNVYRNKSKLY